MKTKTPSESYNLPVIGRIWCKLEASFNGQALKTEENEYEVIKIIDQGDAGKIYVCNAWNSPGVAQLVPGMCVIRFEEL
jgi:hypothetical protein